MKSYKKISELQKLSREVNFMIRRLLGAKATLEAAWILLRKLDPYPSLYIRSGGIDRLIIFIKLKYKISKKRLKGK